MAGPKKARRSQFRPPMSGFGCDLRFSLYLDHGTAQARSPPWSRQGVVMHAISDSKAPNATRRPLGTRASTSGAVVAACIAASTISGYLYASAAAACSSTHVAGDAVLTRRATGAEIDTLVLTREAFASALHETTAGGEQIFGAADLPQPRPAARGHRASSSAPLQAYARDRR